MSLLDVAQWSMFEGRLQVAACSHVGLRQNNEDAYCCAPPFGLVAVADGVGGHRAGEVASRLALGALEDALAKWNGQTLGPLDAVSAAVHDANLSVFDAEKANLAWKGMGTTLSAILFAPPHAALAHVGDCRIYRLPQLGLLEQMTTDHVRPPPHRNVVTRALGVVEQIEVDVRLEDLRAGDRWLICSDGLTGPLADWEIADGLNIGEAPDAARWLVAAALESGGRDNITVVVVEVSPTWAAT